MTAHVFATISVRLVGFILLLYAAIQIPTFLTMLARPPLPEFSAVDSRYSTNSPDYQAKQRATARAKESAEAVLGRTRRTLVFHLIMYVIAGLVLIYFSTPIGELLCRGIEKNS